MWIFEIYKKKNIMNINTKITDMREVNRTVSMKKAMLLLMMCFIATISIWGADKVSFAFLKGEQGVSYVVDWKNLTIAGFSPKNWLEVRQTEQPEYNAKNEYENELKPRINDFISNANKQLENVGLFLSNDKGRKYTVYIRPGNITRKGDNTIECTFVETASGKVMAEFVVNGKGGTLGSMSNLWGDGMKSAGKKFGKVVCKGLGYDPTVRDRIDGVLSKVGIE